MSNFDPYATGYSALNARWLAKCAILAYQNKLAIEAVAQEWEFDRCEFFDCQDTQAFIIRNDDLIVIAFRGTQTDCWRDWMTDAMIAFVPGPFGKVHKGFAAGLDCIWSQLTSTLAQFRNNNQSLFITGHSLGAALATLAAARLQTAGQLVQGVYTFGCPRVGDQAFCRGFNQAFKGKAFRFVNNNDVVTRIAPRTFGYDHAGYCLYFDSKGKLQTEIYYWNEFLDRIQGSMDDFLKPGLDQVNDHDMGAYERNLLTNIEVQVMAV